MWSRGERQDMEWRWKPARQEITQPCMIVSYETPRGKLKGEAQSLDNRMVRECDHSINRVRMPSNMGYILQCKRREKETQFNRASSTHRRSYHDDLEGDSSDRKEQWY